MNLVANSSENMERTSFLRANFVDLLLTKHETFIETEFKISGAAHLVCDRSLEPFDFPIESKNKIVFKYGDEYQEMTDEISHYPAGYSNAGAWTIYL